MTEKKEDINKEKSETKTGKYFYAVGRRKTAVAQVFLYSEKSKEADSIVNKISVKKYFPTETMQNTFFSPLVTVGMQDAMRVSVLVRGGGKNGQVEAARLGIARALVKFNEELKKTLRGAGFLTRDPREVERKKPGLKKARRSPQWKKR